jgi:hypothetical protein
MCGSCPDRASWCTGNETRSVCAATLQPSGGSMAVDMGACPVAGFALEPSTHFEAATGEDVGAHDQYHVSRLGDQRMWCGSELNLGR